MAKTQSSKKSKKTESKEVDEKKQKPDNTLQPAQPATPPDPPKRDRFTVIAYIFIVILAVLILLLLLISWTRGNGQQEPNNGSQDLEGTKDADTDSETTTKPEDNNEPEETPTGDATSNDLARIVYIKDGNVWVVNNDGSGKEQLTTDGGGDVYYWDVDWRSPGVVSYSKCDGQCKVYTKNLATDTRTEILAGIPFTQSIEKIVWSHDGETLAYLFTKGDGSRDFTLWSSGSTTTMHSFAPSPGRGVGFDDGLDIEFSPSDSKVLVLNTMIDDSFDKPVMAFKTDGTSLIELENATFPSFDGNNGFYYKSDEGLKRWDFISSTSSLTTSFVGLSVFGFKTSPNKLFVSYWLLSPADEIFTSYYSIGGSFNVVALNLAEPQWIGDDSQFLIAKRAVGLLMGGYENNGLVRVNKENGYKVTLDAGTIGPFAAE